MNIIFVRFIISLQHDEEFSLYCMLLIVLVLGAYKIALAYLYPTDSYIEFHYN